MGSDVRGGGRRFAGLLLDVLLVAGLVLGGHAVSGFAATPVHASGATDLSVKLSNKADAVPGKRVNYQVLVHNGGPRAAAGVQIDFITTAPLASVTYSIRNGHCYRSPTETACIFYPALKPGANATATISGIMPKKIPRGTTVTNKVTLASNTPLVNTTDDRASDVYQIGIPRTATAPVPSPSASAGSKLVKITDTASRVFDYSKRAVTITFAVLAVALVWFVIGLYLRRRARLARGDFGDELDD